jgi:hypothetical protein
MKRIFQYSVLLGVGFVLPTCKKYDDGGLLRLTRKHLFGGHKVGDSKTWKLEIYEVNSIDSTNLINTGGLSDFYENFVTFTLSDKNEGAYHVINNQYTYLGQIDLSYKVLNFAPENEKYKAVDSAQCQIINNGQQCIRSILNPEMTAYTEVWHIKKLTKKHMILELYYSAKNAYHNYYLLNNYKIELSFK